MWHAGSLGSIIHNGRMRGRPESRASFAYFLSNGVTYNRNKSWVLRKQFLSKRRPSTNVWRQVCHKAFKTLVTCKFWLVAIFAIASASSEMDTLHKTCKWCIVNTIYSSIRRRFAMYVLNRRKANEAGTHKHVHTSSIQGSIHLTQGNDKTHTKWLTYTHNIVVSGQM